LNIAARPSRGGNFELAADSGLSRGAKGLGDKVPPKLFQLFQLSRDVHFSSPSRNAPMGRGF